MNTHFKNYPLENTSDRFSLRDLGSSEIDPAVIPVYSINFLVKMRNSKYIMKYPNQIIINNHSEIAINFSTRKGLNIILKKIKLPGRQLKKEPKLVTLDIYSTYPEFSQRLRFYSQNGVILSVRIITVDNKNKKVIKRNINGCEVPIRKECVLVERSDALSANNVFPETERFFSRHEVCSYVVAKEIERFNFGEGTIWDHRRAVYKSESGKYIDATKKYAVLGMGQYLYLTLQKTKIFNIEKPMTQNKPKELYRMELEYKKKFRKEALFIVGQLIDNFSRENISYFFDSNRKIK